MRKLVLGLAVGAVVSIALAGIAAGMTRDTYKIGATLKPKTEVPAPKGAASATGTFAGTYVENKSGGAAFTWKLTFSKLTGPATAAHIHSGKPGVAGAVIVPLCGPCKSGQTGKTTISKSVIEAIEGGKAYVNVHTDKNAGGEIRGQVKVTG